MMSSSTNTVHPHRSRTKQTDREYNVKDCDAGDNRKRTSIYRGVTRHKRTGRYEAQLWDKDGLNNNQNKKGKHGKKKSNHRMKRREHILLYLGAYDDEEAAAHAYDLVALKYWGLKTILNFPANMYLKEYHEMQSISKEGYVAFLRQHGNEYAKSISEYHGVEQHHINVRWEASIGGNQDNKYNYLGIADGEEPARAYDLAAIEHGGTDGTTNVPTSHYLQQAPQISEVHQLSQLEPSQVEVNSMPHSFSSTQTQPEVSFEDPTNLFSLLWGDPMVEPEATTMAAFLYDTSESPRSFAGHIFEPYMVPDQETDFFGDSFLNGSFEDNYENLLMDPADMEGNLGGGEADPDGGRMRSVDGNVERANEAAKEVVGHIEDVMECPTSVEKMPPPPSSTSPTDS